MSHQSLVVLGLVKIERRLGRNKEERGVFEASFGAGDSPGHESRAQLWA